MAKIRTAEFQSTTADRQLRDQLLTIFRDSRQLKEGSAQMRQRLVGAVFATAQNQLDQARAERFSESEASKGRKGQRQAIGLSAAIPVAGGAITGGIAGGLAGGAKGAGEGALAGASAGFGLPTSRAGAPASALFDTRVVGPSIRDRTTAGGVTQKAITPPAVPGPNTGAQLISPVFPENFAPEAQKAITPAGGVEKATNAIARIAGLDDRQLILVGNDALQAGDQEALDLIAAELQHRGL